MIARRVLWMTLAIALLALASSAAHAYVSIRVRSGSPGQGLPVRWNLGNTAGLPNITNRRILYEIDDFGCRDADKFNGPINEFEAIQNSFAAWRNIHESEVDFEFNSSTTNAVTDGNDNRNVIRWKNSNVSAGVFAVTITTFDTTSGRIVDADMELNDRDFTWDTLGAAGTQGIPQRAMIENVATHEIGHMLGLDHSQVSASSMYFSSSPGLIDAGAVRADDRAPIISSYTSPTVTDPSLGIVRGSVTEGSTPRFGVEVMLIEVATGLVVMGGISEGSAGPFTAGSFEIANVPPGNYMALATPTDRDHLGPYYSTAHVAFYPVLRGVPVGTVGAPQLVQVAPGQTVSGVNISLPGQSQNPFEPDNSSGSATAIESSQAAVSSISPSSDQDWYSITTTSTGQQVIIRAIAYGFGGSLNPTLTLYGTDGSTVLASPVSSHANFLSSANDIDSNAFDLSGPNYDAEIAYTFSNPGTYFFKVASRAGATSGRYVVMLEMPGVATAPDTVASLIESSARGVAANGGGSFTITVTPRDAFSRALNAPNSFTVDLLDVSGASPTVLQTLSGTTPFEFTVPALASPATKRYGARIDGTPIAREIEVSHYGSLSLTNSRIILLERTLSANGYDRIPVRIELRDGTLQRIADPAINVTLDTSRGTLDNGSSSGSNGISAVFDAELGVWHVDLVAGTQTGSTVITAYANSQQIDSATVTALPRATGTGGGPPGSDDDGGGDDDGNGCSQAAGQGALLLVLILLGVLAARRRSHADER